MCLFITYLSESKPVRFAAEELKSYLKRMDSSADIAVLCEEKYDPARHGTLWVGLDAAFEKMLPEVTDKALDDAVYINVEKGEGIVTGTNERSVLIAAYRLLRENGCAFVHPGKNGERVPERKVGTISAKVSEKAASRHRGVCIEGAVSFEHVSNMIRFLPKIGLNAYYIQFFTPRTFFDRWYAHGRNPRVISAAETMGMKRELIREIRQRGLMYHAVGHGWTCLPFGMNADSWEKSDEKISEETRQMLAMVNGKRDLKDGIPLATGLCYSKKIVRDRVTDAVVDYCEQNPGVDYLHFWMADGSNNDCECPDCRHTLPADFYVMMLNELDEKLSMRGIGTRIVFLLYQSLLWAPQRERIRNPERFVLMFAPASRTYSASFLQGLDEPGTLKPFDRNHNVLPKNLGENLAQLRAWQNQFDGDSFDFDYHFMWDHHFELGGYDNARILMEDMQNLDQIGLNGMISCQNQRAFFPTALGIHAMAAGLWDHNISFTTLADRYFTDAFGKDAEEVRQYYETVSRLYDAPYLRGEKPPVSEEQAAKYDKLMHFAKDYEKKAAERASNGDQVTDGEWRMLGLHAGLIRCMANALGRRAEGKTDEAKALWQDALTYIGEIEAETGERLDTMFFTGTNAALFQ